MPRREISDDDELARMLRALDPVDFATGPELDARRERIWSGIVERIDAEPSERAGRRRRARMWWIATLPAAAAAVVALIVVLVVDPFGTPAPAAAEGLPPLVYEASDLSFEEHLARARDQLAQSPGPAEPVREATVVAWYSHTQMDGEDRGTVISPEVVSTAWDETFAMHIRVTAGRPYVAGDDQPPTRADPPKEGTVLRDDEIPSEMNLMDGERPIPFLVAGSGVDFYRSYVAESIAMYGPGGGAEALRAVADLKNHWTLTNAQEADLLTVLEEYDGLETLGVAHDRAGRKAFGISARSATGMHDEVMLISTETGRILGSETIYLGDEPEFPIPTGSVMSYQMWGLGVDGH
ncbi:hypothetical protein [Microbacterium sp. CPCC 204701]|uniref:hypothetical protein n=1 Tax=Microbacterium sp. CPCC 204701 TaxID=2493084 RepID=UPI000FDB33D6|nr:hypothetical protein [Microbacterium sp. CPCC 204701]